jgi:hypothetical protein
LYKKTTVPDLPSDKAVWLTLIVGMLCLSALLPPADLFLARSYQRTKAVPHGDTNPEATFYEDSASGWDDICSQWSREYKRLHFLLPIFMAHAPRQGGEGRHPASSSILVPVRFFPLKISPPSAPDGPFLN